MRRKTEVNLPKKVKVVEADVVVVGGGLSGITTALTCANDGLKTFLVEEYGFPGGLISTAFAYPLRVFNFQRSLDELFTEEGTETIKYPIFSTLIRYLLKNKAIPRFIYPDPLKISGGIIPFDLEMFKNTMLELLLDFKINLLFHASFVRAKLMGDVVSSILVLGKEGLIEVRGKYFVDATGNCAVFKSIDENLTAKVKSLARYNFIINGCDFSKNDDRIVCESVRIENSTYHAYVVEKDNVKVAIYELPIKNHCVVFGLSDNSEFSPDDIVSISMMEEKLQLKVYSFLEHLRQFKPFEKANISMFPAQIYFTGGCRINGLYTLTAEDVFNNKSFDDEVAVLKISSPAEKLFPCVLAPDKKFDNSIIRIPFSSFLTKIKNLVAVGRNASVSEDLKFVLYSFPFVVKASESIGRLISFAHKNDLKLNQIARTKAKLSG
ncbi:MAG: FAD-dependent oxidoreductase [Candidatus Kryptonium sp.]